MHLVISPQLKLLLESFREPLRDFSPGRELTDFLQDFIFKDQDALKTFFH